METPAFVLGETITPEQRAFFEERGFIRFSKVASDAECDRLIAAMDELERRFIAEGRDAVMGVPIQWGRRSDGSPFVNRFAYASHYSPTIREFVRDRRFEPVRQLIGEGARLAELEKDGVVINNFLNTEGSAYRRLGWHTDSPRDLFYNRTLPKPMLNVGLYLDDCPLEKGGVRLLPGTHTQGVWQMLFRKFPMFLTHRPDPAEVPLIVERGDLTIHDGRAWHRTARAELTGEASRRRTMYMAYIEGPPAPRSEDSPTPLFKRFQRLIG